MQTLTYHYIDKTRWRRGEWDAEPDKMQWSDAATGLPCLAVRHRKRGYWCGYVGVAPGHPYYGQDYEAVDYACEVHGGLTFAGACVGAPAPAEPEAVWWLGFDCAHGGDDIPDSHRHAGLGFVYRSLAYVQAECAALAQQLAALAHV